MLGYNLYL